MADAMDPVDASAVFSPTAAPVEHETGLALNESQGASGGIPSAPRFPCRTCGQETEPRRIVRSGDLRFQIRVCPDGHQSDHDLEPPAVAVENETARAVVVCACGHPRGSHLDGGVCMFQGCYCTEARTL